MPTIQTIASGTPAPWRSGLVAPLKVSVVGGSGGPLEHTLHDFSIPLKNTDPSWSNRRKRAKIPTVRTTLSVLSLPYLGCSPSHPGYPVSARIFFLVFSAPACFSGSLELVSTKLLCFKRGTTRSSVDRGSQMVTRSIRAPRSRVHAVHRTHAKGRWHVRGIRFRPDADRHPGAKSGHGNPCEGCPLGPAFSYPGGPRVAKRADEECGSLAPCMYTSPACGSSPPKFFSAGAETIPNVMHENHLL